MKIWIKTSQSKDGDVTWYTKETITIFQILSAIYLLLSWHSLRCVQLEHELIESKFD